jgi:hypothetical protein
MQDLRRPHRNVRRYEHNYFTGWVVQITRRRRRQTRYFPDEGDPRRALRKALAWRDTQIEELPPPVKLRINWPKNRTGVIGVALVRDRGRRGQITERYVATWFDLHGRRRKRSFAIRKYGRGIARDLAFETRRKAVAEIMTTSPKGPLPPRPGRKRQLVHTEARPTRPRRRRSP